MKYRKGHRFEVLGVGLYGCQVKCPVQQEVSRPIGVGEEFRVMGYESGKGVCVPPHGRGDVPESVRRGLYSNQLRSMQCETGILKS